MSNNSIASDNASVTSSNDSSVTNNTGITIWTSANSSPLHMFITVLNVILIFLILVGNSLTIRAVTKFRRLRNQSSVMIAALAVADILMGIYTPVRLLRNHLPHLFGLKPPCYVFMFLSHYTAITAVTFLSLLSLERFYSIQFPFHYYAHATATSAVVFSVVVYLIVAVVIIPTVSGTAMWYDGVECYAPTLYPGFYTRIIVAMCIGPLVIGFLAFLRVCFAEFRFRKIIHDLDIAATRKQESLKTKLLLTAYIVSLSFWMPHLLFYLFNSISKTGENLYIFRVVSFLDLGSSAVNCFLYAWKNSKFKAAYKQLLGFKSSVESISASETAETALYD